MTICPIALGYTNIVGAMVNLGPTSEELSRKIEGCKCKGSECKSKPGSTATQKNGKKRRRNPFPGNESYTWVPWQFSGRTNRRI